MFGSKCQKSKSKSKRTYSLNQRFPSSLPLPPALLDVAHKSGVILDLQQILVVPLIVDPLPISVHTRDGRANERVAGARQCSTPVHPPTSFTLRNRKSLLSRCRLPILIISQRLRACLSRLRALHPRRRLPLSSSDIAHSSSHLLPQPTRSRTRTNTGTADPAPPTRPPRLPPPHRERRRRHRFMTRTRPHTRRIQRMHPHPLHPQRPVRMQLRPIIVPIRERRRRRRKGRIRHVAPSNPSCTVPVLEVRMVVVLVLRVHEPLFRELVLDRGEVRRVRHRFVVSCSCSPSRSSSYTSSIPKSGTVPDTRPLGRRRRPCSRAYHHVPAHMREGERVRRPYRRDGRQVLVVPARDVWRRGGRGCLAMWCRRDGCIGPSGRGVV